MTQDNPSGRSTVPVSLRQLSDAERIQLLIDAVTDYAIFMLDVDGTITSWNSGAQKLKGYAAPEIIGQHYSRFFTPEDRARGLPARNLTEARLTGRCESEGWRLRKDGSRFYALAVLQAVRTAAGELIGFAKITRDITERKQAQDRLVESERRFRLLVEGVVDYAIFMLDASGVVTNWNAGAQRLKGYRASAIIGQHFSRFYTPEDRAAGVPARILEEARQQGRAETEGWRVRQDGSRFWASIVIDAIRDESGTLVGFAKVTRDITERRAAQEALRESERQFRLLVRGVTDCALFMLDPSGVVTSWNIGAERIKGYTADAIVGQHFARFYTEQDRTAGVPAAALQAAIEKGSFEAEGWRVRKDGTLFWANVVIDAIRDETGTLIGFAKITRDITERRNAQLALEQTRAQRDQAQKMEALGQLTGGVAHDFNNLLMIVGGHARALTKLVGSDPAGIRATDAIERAVNRGAALTRQLLTFSRRQSLTPAALDLPTSVEAVRLLVASSIGSAVRLQVEMPAGTWPVTADPNEFELALVNLCINARDAMPEGGGITVGAKNVVLKPADTPAGIEGEFVAISVTDTGTGIAPDILPRVFDPFFTTKQKGGRGSGLGLSQVHGFVHQSGGTVTVATELGAGTTITLYLPRSAGAAQKAEQTEKPAADHRRDETVLLVEDNPEVAEVSQSMLEQLGYHVHTAPDAASALEIIERGEPKLDLVVSDIVMAGPLDGVGLARTVKALHPELPVLLVTGYSEAATVAGVEFPLLRKPYQMAQLSRATANAISRSKSTMTGNLIDIRTGRRA